MHPLHRQLIPGRSREARAASATELKATAVIRVPLSEASAKVSAGFPDDTDEDLALDVWAGVVPIVSGYGAPIDAPDLRDGVALSPSVQRLIGGQ